MKVNLFAGTLLFFSSFDFVYLTAGTGFKDSSRYFSVGAAKDFNAFLKSRYEIGYWKDPVNSSSVYGSYQIGLVATNKTLYADFFTGPSLITTPDARLSTPFEFKHDLGIGIVGKEKVRVGINYSHLSNAGIREPNRGRDSIQVKLVFLTDQ